MASISCRFISTSSLLFLSVAWAAFPAIAAGTPSSIVSASPTSPYPSTLNPAWVPDTRGSVSPSDLPSPFYSKSPPPGMTPVGLKFQSHRLPPPDYYSVFPQARFDNTDRRPQSAHPDDSVTSILERAAGEKACFRSPQLETKAHQLFNQTAEIVALAEEAPVFITPCCRTLVRGQPALTTFKVSLRGAPPVEVHTAENNGVQHFSVFEDPYVTGRMYDVSKNPTSPSFNFGYWSYNNVVYNTSGLTQLGRPNQIEAGTPYRVPPKKSLESTDAYFERRLREELAVLGRTDDPALIATIAGQGSQSRAYYIHDPIPEIDELRRRYPDSEVIRKLPHIRDLDQARRNLWVSENSKEVLKLRTPTPWGQTLRKAAQQAKRDIVLSELFETLSSRFTLYNGEKIVEVVKYDNQNGELSRGVFRQEAVHGESAFMIADRIKRAMAGNQGEVDYLIHQLNFSSLEDAKLRINALEHFYRASHDDVFNFQVANDIQGGKGYTFSGNVVSIGFDYNLGINVMWDPKKRIFRAFDY